MMDPLHANLTLPVSASEKYILKIKKEFKLIMKIPDNSDVEIFSDTAFKF